MPEHPRLRPDIEPVGPDLEKELGAEIPPPPVPSEPERPPAPSEIEEEGDVLHGGSPVEKGNDLD